MRRVAHTDRALLAGALVLGIAATLRAWGVGEGITFVSLALLAGAALLALQPLMRLCGALGGDGERRTAVIAAIFGTHLVATLFFFPPEDIVNERPVLTLDHALHFYQCSRQREASADFAGPRLYDPYFMAGYPGGMAFDLDAKGPELWCSLLRVIDTARAYKLFIVLVYLLLFFGVYAGCRNLRCEFDETVYGLLLFLVYWHWGRPYAAQFRFAGMFSYLFACYLAFYLIGLFAAVLRGERARLFYVVGAVAFFVHPTTAVLVPVPFLALYLVARRRLPAGDARRAWHRRAALRFALWCLVVLAANALWLVSFPRQFGERTSITGYFQIQGMGGFLGMILKPSRLLVLPLFVFSVAGVVHLVRTRRLSDAVAPAVGSVFLFLVASFGTYVPYINQLEPGRFVVPAILFLAPLAGTGFASSAAAIRRKYRDGSLYRIAHAGAVSGLVICIPVLGLAASREYYRHTVTTTCTREVRGLIEAIKERASPVGRLMIEDGPAWKYGNCLLPAILPLSTRVEQIGGPYPYSFLPHRFAGFERNRVFGQALAEFEPDRFAAYLDLYNVHWIVTATAECGEEVERLLGGGPSWRSGTLAIWDIPTASSFASEPGVVVRASVNEIEVLITRDSEEAVPAEILLKYHWDRGLEVAPPARISPRRQMDDPVPFILLEPNGEKDIRIRFRGSGQFRSRG